MAGNASLAGSKVIKLQYIQLIDLLFNLNLKSETKGHKVTCTKASVGYTPLVMDT